MVPICDPTNVPNWPTPEVSYRSISLAIDSFIEWLEPSRAWLRNNAFDKDAHVRVLCVIDH
jgi:hypothetical protein